MVYLDWRGRHVMPVAAAVLVSRIHRISLFEPYSKKNSYCSSDIVQRTLKKSRVFSTLWLACLGFFGKNYWLGHEEAIRKKKVWILNRSIKKLIFNYFSQVFGQRSDGEEHKEGTGGGVVGGALLATKMVIAAKALATDIGVKAKARECQRDGCHREDGMFMTSEGVGAWMQSVCGLEFALGNRFTYARAFTNAVLDLFPIYDQISSHAGDKRYEFLKAENNRVQRELVAVVAKRCMMRLVFVSENQDHMSTKNKSEVGLAQGRTGVNDTREHVQELERECVNMKYEILEVKTKRGWSFLYRLSNDVYRTILLDKKTKQNSGLIGNLVFKFVALCC
ncbi:hypothetical protein Tco_0750034 [Tanacetum coccineum]|uniref:Uncharacterized protein n=1 Tax=Tanacetum coccineum TaxID=301880 RepID=A0ABQ4Z3A9_9ASTR